MFTLFTGDYIYQEKKPNLEEMLSKFISVSETRFQNTETALKNQQASIQGLETQIGQLSKLISERPQGSLPSNTEPNPREQLNAINMQDDKGVVEPEPEPRQETVVSKGQGEVDQNTNKPVTVEYKPRVPYHNVTRKDRSDEKFGKFLKLLKKLHINLPFIEALSQMPNAMKFLKELLANKRKLDEASHKMSLMKALESFSSNSKGPVHKDRRLQNKELDEWRMHKPRTPDKLKLLQNEPNTSQNQLKVGDKVLLYTADPHIVTTTLNEEIPLTVLSIFPFGTVEVSHPKFSSFKGKRFPQHGLRLNATAVWYGCGQACQNNTGRRHIRVEEPWANLLKQHGRSVVKPVKLTRAWGLHTQAWEKLLMSSSRGKKTVVPTSKKRKGASSSASPTAKIRHLLLQFLRGPQEELFQILRARPLIASHCIDWATTEQVQMADAIRALLTTDPWELFFGIIKQTYLELMMELYSKFHFQTVMTNYDDPAPNKAASEGGHLHWPLRDSTGATLRAPQHHGPRIIPHPIGQMSPQGISSMLSMRMIERRRGTYPPQYHLAQSTEDDVPPQHEDPPTQPPPPSLPVHAADSYADISERLTRFKQQLGKLTQLDEFSLAFS
ncbi:hypothetical protein GOBAR_AA11797 [Gossypium barbadense]|uniref:Uncharacterized protein n=1 Tax=Gossypium barbadense TaxID=3634 RepID=A0A2P5XZS1_GOSBA|nr:hypothetical protein GOBAR_AA11797 [Gossypium barbadense]